MLRGQPNNLKHLGPSFFTKFLYAADAQGSRPGRALILDQFVAVALKDLDAGTSPAPDRGNPRHTRIGSITHTGSRPPMGSG